MKDRGDGMTALRGDVWKSWLEEWLI